MKRIISKELVLVLMKREEKNKNGWSPQRRRDRKETYTP